MDTNWSGIKDTHAAHHQLNNETNFLWAIELNHVHEEAKISHKKETYPCIKYWDNYNRCQKLQLEGAKVTS
jgi:hypothetical protein